MKLEYINIQLHNNVNLNTANFGKKNYKYI